MKASWAGRTCSRNVILFLNGWGMDVSTIAHAPLPEGWDMLMLFNYSDLSLPDDVPGCLQSNARVVLVAWSMGVWAAGALTPFAGAMSGSIAINGTPMPVHDLYGIPPELYRATVDSFSETSRLSFYRRMCGNRENLDRFMKSPPAREQADQHAELAAIERLAVADGAVAPFPFRRAVVGSGDRIVPPANQERFWTAHGGCDVRDMPHFPFFHMTWEAIIARATDN